MINNTVVVFWEMVDTTIASEQLNIGTVRVHLIFFPYA